MLAEGDASVALVEERQRLPSVRRDAGLEEIDRFAIVGDGDRVFQLGLDVLAQAAGGFFFAVREKDSLNLTVEMADPADQVIAVGVARKAVNLSSFRTYGVLRAMDADARRAIEDDAA